MFRIALVNMPFSEIEMPSIALTQLKARVEQELGSEVRAEISYPSHDFCNFLGLDLYRLICNEVSNSALGDWMFRRLAFPEEPDTAQEYRQRYYPMADDRYRAFERVSNADLGKLLDKVIDKYHLLDADLVGLTSMFSQNVASFALARALKDRKPGIVTAIGGANCETPMGEEIARGVAALDYVFSGPALTSFPELVRALIAGDRGRAARLGGVFTRANQAPGEAARVAPLGPERDINAEVVPLDYRPFLDTLETTFHGRCLEHDLHPAWNLLIGFPGETDEVYKGYAEAMPKLTHFPPPTGVHPVRFDRFSPYFTQAEQYQLDLAPFDFYALIYPFPAASLERLAYFFVDRNVLAPYFLHKAKWLSRLRQVHARWYDAWAGGRPPVLAFERQGSTRIVDSRSGTTAVHDVGEAGRRILQAHDKPSTLPELATALAADTADTAGLAAEVGRLRELGLLFDDRQRMVSLVMPRPVAIDRLIGRFARKPAAEAAA